MSYQDVRDDRNVILAVAPTGGVHGKGANTTLPEQLGEIAEQVAERFVSPMKADICNDHHEFSHTEDCNIFRQFVDDAPAEGRSRLTDGVGRMVRIPGCDGTNSRR